MSTGGQFVTTNCEVKHLREAMPFDRIVVTMQIHKIWRRGLNLYFEYFKLEPSGDRIKIAYGHNTLAWCSIDESDKYITQDMPDAFFTAKLY